MINEHILGITVMVGFIFGALFTWLLFIVHNHNHPLHKKADINDLMNIQKREWDIKYHKNKSDLKSQIIKNLEQDIEDLNSTIKQLNENNNSEWISTNIFPNNIGLYFIKRINEDIVLAYCFSTSDKDNWMELGYSNNYQKEHPTHWQEIKWPKA